MGQNSTKNNNKLYQRKDKFTNKLTNKDIENNIKNFLCNKNSDYCNSSHYTFSETPNLYGGFVPKQKRYLNYDIYFAQNGGYSKNEKFSEFEKIKNDFDITNNNIADFLDSNDNYDNNNKNMCGDSDNNSISETEREYREMYGGKVEDEDEFFKLINKDIIRNTRLDSEQFGESEEIDKNDEFKESEELEKDDELESEELEKEDELENFKAEQSSINTNDINKNNDMSLNELFTYIKNTNNTKYENQSGGGKKKNGKKNNGIKNKKKDIIDSVYEYDSDVKNSVYDINFDNKLEINEYVSSDNLNENSYDEIIV